MLEQEERRACAKHADRNLTDSEAQWFEQRLQQIVADAKAEIFAHIERLQQAHVEALADAFRKYSGEFRGDIKRYIDERLAKLKTGPQGARGERGQKGEYGARGIQGKEGPRGKPGTTIEKWEIDRRSYTFWPVMSDGTTGPQLQLKSLFEQFLTDVKGSR
jgi:Collagen triple helix repeat (20 copies)